MKDQLIAAERIDPRLCRTLAALLDTMIPENEELCAPSAGTDEVLNDVVGSMAGETTAVVLGLLKQLDEQTSAMFAELPSDERTKTFEALQRTEPRGVRALGGLLLQCYYRNDQVLASLGMEARPPFPRGYDVEQGDWSLLDAVKTRGKIYREV